MTSTLQTTRKAGKFSRYFCSLWLQSFCWYMLGVRVSFAYCQWLLWMVCWVKNPNYKFMAEVVFSYCLALHVFWARVRRNNSTAINVSKTKFSPLFFGLNMPFYMETCMRDSFVHLPRVSGWFYIRGQKQENNDVDPKLCLMWRNVCRCIDKLEKVISAILKFKKNNNWLTFFILIFSNHDVVRAFPFYSAKRCLGCGCSAKAQGMNSVLACLFHPPTLRAHNPQSLGIFPPFSTESTKWRLLNCGERGLWLLRLCGACRAPYGWQWQGWPGVPWACRSPSSLC